MSPLDRWAVGVDIGGTKIAAALVSSGGEVRSFTVIPTPARSGSAAVLDAVAELARALLAEAGGEHVVGLGVGTGGVVDRWTGTVVSSTALLSGWAGTPVAAELTARLGIPVVVDNDGNTLAIGEQRFGAGTGLRDVLYVAVGTGIGGAVVVRGRIVRGAHHTAGELGHVSVPEADGRTCSCGATGHLEAVASGPAMASSYAQAARPAEPTSLPVIAERAAHGDPAAVAALAGGANALGRALAGLVNVFDPEAVVLGGGVSSLGHTYLEAVDSALRAHALPGPARGLKVSLARLGARAGVLGAAALLHTPDPDPPSPTPRGATHARREGTR